jgi:hypothetical protein
MNCHHSALDLCQDFFFLEDGLSQLSFSNHICWSDSCAGKGFALFSKIEYFSIVKKIFGE